MNQTRKMLKAMSIVLIILGGFGVISLFTQSNGASSSILLKCLSVASTVVTLIAGIFGIMQSSKPEKSNICVGLGCLIILLAIVTSAVSLINMAPIIDSLSVSIMPQLSEAGISYDDIKAVISNIAFVSTIFGLITSLIFPLLYIRGASKKLK